MVKTFRLLTIAFLLHAASSAAMPVLSPDGSLLTGVDVGGTIYDVTFGDGVVGDVYASVTFDAAREAEANAVSAALVAALNGLGVVDPGSIAGCSGAPLCILFTPDRFTGGTLAFRDDMSALGSTSGPTVWTNIPDTAAIGASIDTSSNTSFTLVTFRQAEVPIPATVALFCLGLVGLGMNRRQRHRHSLPFLYPPSRRPVRVLVQTGTLSLRPRQTGRRPADQYAYRRRQHKATRMRANAGRRRGGVRKNGGQSSAGMAWSD